MEFNVVKLARFLIDGNEWQGKGAGGAPSVAGLPGEAYTPAISRRRRNARNTWVPEREGNWRFHCHIREQAEGMRGLVMGILGLDRSRAASRLAATPASASIARRMRLLARPSRGSSVASPLFTCTVHERGAEPDVPSSCRTAPMMELERTRPVRVTVVNRLAEPTAVHWHGMEPESCHDGVPGFSGAGRRTTPMIGLPSPLLTSLPIRLLPAR